MLRKKTPPWKGDSPGPMIVACKSATVEGHGTECSDVLRKGTRVTAGLQSLGGGRLVGDLPVEQVVTNGACTARGGRVLADVLQLLLDPL